jgi:hypothetical protein
MRIVFPVLAVLLLTSGTTLAAPLVLKCTAEGGIPAADLVVDTENKTLMWGNTKYLIRSINERYISAYEQASTDQVGGETWVLNRATGEYLRAEVAITWPSPESYKNHDPGTLTASTFRGICARPIL